MGLQFGGLDLGVGGGLRLGGGQSPMVHGANVPLASVGTAAYGAGATTPQGGTGSIFGTTPGHLAVHLSTLALVALVLIRHSLPR